MLHDSEIREPLFDFLEETYGRIRVIEEKMMGRSRADVVMVLEDALCGVEIKSDADTYARLSRQVKDYEKEFGTFISETIDADTKPLRERFLRNVPDGGTILDLGCGSGRDTMAFFERGIPGECHRWICRDLPCCFGVYGNPCEMYGFLRSAGSGRIRWDLGVRFVIACGKE